MQITIEKLVYGGDGLGRLPADEQGRGKAVFVPFVLEGETVEVAIGEQRPGFARAELKGIVTPSPRRVEPPCPYFGRCGGCNYQHTDYEEQLRIKQTILRETLQRTAKIELDSEIVVHSAKPWGYRNRTRMKVAHEPEFSVGYFRHGSHELLAVRECPISSPLIGRALAALWELGEAGKVHGDLREIQWLANGDDSQLIVELYATRGADAQNQRALAEALRAAIPELTGVAVFEGAQGWDDGSEQEAIGSIRPRSLAAFGDSVLTYKVDAHEYRVSAGAFFQTNRFLASELVATALRDLAGRVAVDLYAGVGLFSLPLAERFEKVVAVEASPFSAGDLRANATPKISAIQQTTEQWLRGNPSMKADLVVVDPPRSGLGEATARALGKLRTSRVTYISCDPSTLSRDLRVLLQSGFRVEQAHLVDLFPQTFHMESVFHLVR